jgi:hypothetical protein
MLLSPRAIEKEGDVVYAWISKAALQHLMSTPAGSKNAKTPKFALADHLATGQCSEVPDATWIEKQCVALSQMRGVIKKVDGGKGKVLQSHLLAWLNQNTTIASKLPLSPGELIFVHLQWDPLLCS